MSTAIRIAIFQLCVFGAMAWLATTGIFSTTVSSGIAINSVQASIDDTLPTQDTYTSSTITTYIFGDFLRMWKTMFTLIGYALFPITLFHSLGISNTIVDILAIMCTVMYAIATIEFIANRKIERG